MEEIIQEALSKGVELHVAGEYDLASQLYASVIKLQPEHADANHNMGVLKLTTGHELEALSFLQTALQADTTIAQFWLSYIKALIKLARLDEAARILDLAKESGFEGGEFAELNQLLNTPTENAVVVDAEVDTPSQSEPNILDSLKLNQALRLAEKKATEGNAEEALGIYKDMLAKFPKNKRAQQGLAALNKPKQPNRTQKPPQNAISQLADLYNQGQFAAVVEQAKALINKHPETFIVWNILGAAHKGLGKTVEASAAFKRVTELNPNYEDGYSNLGVTLKDQGKLDEAIEAYNKALSLKPDYADAWYNMGNARQDQGKVDEAIACYNEALSLKPDYADAWYNMGIILQEQGKLDEAIETYNQALAINPYFAAAYYNMGNALKDQGKLDEAIACYNKALSLQPNDAAAFYNMGLTLKEQGKLEEAIAAYIKALNIKPHYAEAYNNMGIIFKELGKLEEAIEAYDKALSTKSNYAEAYNNMGLALYNQGKLDEAIASYEQAISLKPDYAEAYNNMGNAIQDHGKLDEAIVSYEKAISLKPNYAEAYNNMGNALQDRGKPDRAIKAYKKALAIKPDFRGVHENLSFALLNVGELRDGLEEYEWRLKDVGNLVTKREFSIPVWDGQKSLKGKSILLWSEQGVGDTINWSSRLPLISAQAEQCTLECPEKLVTLLRRSFPNVEIKLEDKSRDLERDDYDFHLPMGSLYKHFIPQILENRKLDAFLVPDPIRINFWTERLKSLGGGPYVGVSWKSSSMSPKRLPNYAQITEWLPIFKIDGITYINLQYTDYESDLAKIKSEFGVTVHNFDDLDHYNNIDDVAALCAALDMVVSTKITVPFISSGVGTITKLANWRQSNWNNILLNPVGQAIDIFEKNTWEPWDNVFYEIAADIIKLKTSLNSTSGSL